MLQADSLPAELPGKTESSLNVLIRVPSGLPVTEPSGHFLVLVLLDSRQHLVQLFTPSPQKPLLHLVSRHQHLPLPSWLLPGPRRHHGPPGFSKCLPWVLPPAVCVSTTAVGGLLFTVKEGQIISALGDGNGSPLRCSCLENPRDRGAWWAGVYGVAQSQTRVKRLSSSSSISALGLQQSLPTARRPS